MIAALVLAISVATSPAALLEQCRETWRQATSDTQRIQADVELLDAILGQAWAHEMVVDGALLGVPDVHRRQAAAAVLDEAIMSSARLDDVLQRMARDGQPVSLWSRRWRARRGVACAAAGLLARDDTRDRLLREAKPLLSDAVAANTDPTGRARRMLAAVCMALNDSAGASRQLAMTSADESLSPTERIAMQISRWHAMPDAAFLSAVEVSIDGAADAWQVHLLGDAAMSQATDLSAASRVATVWRRNLERIGLTPQQAAHKVRHAAALLYPLVGQADKTTDAACVAGMIEGALAGSGTQEAHELIEAAAAGERSGFDRALVLEAIAQVVTLQAGGIESVVAWRDAASAATGAHRRQLLDRAARQAVLSGAGGQDELLIEAVLLEAAADGQSRDHWLLTLAHHAATRGDVHAAIERLSTITPGSDVHADAMELMLHLLCQRLRAGTFETADQQHIDALRAAAMIAHRRGSTQAGEVAAKVAMLRIERSLLEGDLTTARTLRRGDKAMTLARESDRFMIDAQIAASAGDRVGVQRMTDALETAQRRDLLHWMGAYAPSHADVVAASLGAEDLSGDASADVALADALKRSGRVDQALTIYESVLRTSPSFVAAILGQCDCLWQSGDRSDLAKAAQGYRRIAAMPRQDDPARWRLANERLLAVLARAGANPAKLRARCARLQAIDPELTCSGEARVGVPH